MANSMEILPIVDTDGRVLGSAPRTECHNGKTFLMHPVVHLHLYNPKKGLLLQKRSRKKKIQPGIWDTAVGGHVDFGESIPEALKREVSEEIGIAIPDNTSLIKVYEFRSAVECELIYCHVALINDNIEFSISEPDDIDELKFISLSDISDVTSEHFTPNFVHEYKEIILPHILSHDFSEYK